MSTFQVVNMKILEGKAKAPPHRDYKMLVVGGLFTGDDGVVEMGEITFMNRDTAPIPTNLELGKKYTPTIGAVTRDGKLSFQITELKSVAAIAKAA